MGWYSFVPRCHCGCGERERERARETERDRERQRGERNGMRCVDCCCYKAGSDIRPAAHALLCASVYAASRYVVNDYHTSFSSLCHRFIHLMNRTPSPLFHRILLRPFSPIDTGWVRSEAPRRQHLSILWPSREKSKINKLYIHRLRLIFFVND